MMQEKEPPGIAPHRVYLYGALLVVLCLAQVRLVAAQGYGDWSAFWAAGATAGTRDLLDPQRHTAWQHAHHLVPTIFPYLPGAALFLSATRTLPLPAGYAINFVLMSIAALISGLLAARLYGIRKDIAVILTFAWAPVIAAIATGQNAPLLLLFSVLAIRGFATQSSIAMGFAVGAMLYKPLYALPFIVLFLLRREWRGLGIVTACAGAWYVLSVTATAGDWSWPVHYAAAISGYVLHDFYANAGKAISIPQFALRLGVMPAAAYAAGAFLFLLALPAVARMAAVEAASVVPLIALACGPHTLPYDVTLALPAMFFFAGNAAEPLRSRIVALMYLLAPLWVLCAFVQFDILAVICIGFTAIVLYKARPSIEVRLADIVGQKRAAY
jgi:hypothetical protein